MTEFTDCAEMKRAAKVFLHGEILRHLDATRMPKEEVARLTGLTFNRHTLWRLREGPDAISWSAETFAYVASCIGLPVESETRIRVGGTAFVHRQRGNLTRARRPGSANASPALAA